MRKLLGVALIAIVVVALAALAFFAWPLRELHPPPQLAHGALAVRDATLYVSPDRPPLEHATLLARDGVITAVGSDVAVPTDATTLTCAPCTVTSAFWNAHVHFTERKWANAEWKSAAVLEAQLADMLTSRGFATVVDLGSNPRDTVALRRRIERGELAGPRIYTAGPALYPEHGIPFYVRDTIPPFLQHFMPQPESPDEAARDVVRGIDWFGADVLKLFTGSHVERGYIKPMREDIARAAVTVAHAHHQLAFAHPSNLVGVQVALASGVDVLAHAPSRTRGVDENMLATMALRTTMVPTLKMFATTVTRAPEFMAPIQHVVRRIHELGGKLMFGTDVGYMHDYTTAEEFDELAACGLSPNDILDMLTTRPARAFGVADRTGTLEPGKHADLVVLGVDGLRDAHAFTAVDSVVRGGRVLWQRPR